MISTQAYPFTLRMDLPSDLTSTLKMIHSYPSYHWCSPHSLSLKLPSLENSHWQENFSGNKVDTSTWSTVKRGKPDWKNTMSNDPRLIEVSKGTSNSKVSSMTKKTTQPLPDRGPHQQRKV
ncbi:hypothetical protein [Rubritalea tangerina]|uniref:hypothetical protein n=1 Tax=Rubritalea tangerina TaxID=430798 RepID=UPI003609AEEC